MAGERADDGIGIESDAEGAAGEPKAKAGQGGDDESEDEDEEGEIAWFFGEGELQAERQVRAGGGPTVRAAQARAAKPSHWH